MRVEGQIPLSNVDIYGPGKVVNVLLVTCGEFSKHISVGRIHLKAWEVVGPIRMVVRLG